MNYLELIRNIHLILEIAFIILSIITTIYCFFTRSTISGLGGLIMKTNFESINNSSNILILNYFEDEFENNKTNKYEEFFNKYDLKEGQTFNDNKDLVNSLDNLDKISLAIVIILIISFFFSLFFGLFFISFAESSVSLGVGFAYVCIISALILRTLIIIILLSVFISYAIGYKNQFENDFFELYNNINNNNEQASFKEYYYTIFNIKEYFIINIIVNPLNILISIVFLIVSKIKFRHI